MGNEKGRAKTSLDWKRAFKQKEMESEDGKRDSTAKLGKTPTKKGLRMIIPTVELGENKD